MSMTNECAGWDAKCVKTTTGKYIYCTVCIASKVVSFCRNVECKAPFPTNTKFIPACSRCDRSPIQLDMSRALTSEEEPWWGKPWLEWASAHPKQ